MADADLIKVAEAGRRLDLTPETVRKLIKSGAIPGMRLGGQLRVDWTALQEQRRRASEWRPEEGEPDPPPALGQVERRKNRNRA